MLPLRRRQIPKRERQQKQYANRRTHGRKTPGTSTERAPPRMNRLCLRLSQKADQSDYVKNHSALDDWLRRRALQNEASGASRTYVLCVGKRVVGYYALAVGAVAHIDAPGRIRAILVHSISERAKRFYEKWGFISSPIDPMTLMITAADARKALVEKSDEQRTEPEGAS